MTDVGVGEAGRSANRAKIVLVLRLAIAAALVVAAGFAPGFWHWALLVAAPIVGVPPIVRAAVPPPAGRSPQPPPPPHPQVSSTPPGPVPRQRSGDELARER